MRMVEVPNTPSTILTILTGFQMVREMSTDIRFVGEGLETAVIELVKMEDALE